MSGTQTNPWQAVCTLADLKAGQFIECSLPRVEAGLATHSDTLPPTGFIFLDGSTPRAYLNQCPHMGVELNWKPGSFMDSDNLFLQCSTHGALFKPRDGECVAGPCQGDALTPLDIRVIEGLVEVRFPE